MTDDPENPSDNIVRLPPDGHKRKRPGGRTPEGKGNGFVFKPASGIAARGAGFGGPANGPGQHGSVPGSGRTAQNVREKAERIAAFNDMIFDLAMQSESESTRLQAAIAGLNRLEGAPINKQIVYEADSIKELTDDELREQLEELRRKGTGA
jgi:hypothetical protein